MSEGEPRARHAAGRQRQPRWVRIVAVGAVMSLVVVALVAGHSSRSGAKPRALGPVPIGTMAAHPNIVFVLADDLSSNLVPYMPHVLAMERHGATFSHYFVTDSLCCPSRTSIFTGLYPHDSGVYSNTGSQGGYRAFDRLGNVSRTFALALQQSGYRTGLMGKYLNGYEPYLRARFTRPYVPEGWNDWDVAGDGYREFNYLLNEDHRVVHYGSGPSAYLTGVLSRLASGFVARSVPSDASSDQPRPFALEVATFAPHDPYVYAPRDGRRFRHLRAPRTPAFNADDRVGNPRWLNQPPLARSEIHTIDRDFRHRVRSVQAIDRMLGALEDRVRTEGLTNDTYFVFSSDNGYHMGEHRLRPGKMTAFDTDIRVPLVIVGPGIKPGMRIGALAENVDLAPTFEELAGRTPRPSVDGRSLVPLLEGHRPAMWRRAVLVEHHGPDVDVDDPDYPMQESGNPPSYEAIRLTNAVYVEYVDGEREYYDTAVDPYELRNAYGDLSATRRATLHRELRGLVNCHGGASCHRADQLRAPPLVRA